MTLLRSDRYASANTAHIMIVTMSGLHKAVPGQNELKRIRDQILIVYPFNTHVPIQPYSFPMDRALCTPPPQMLDCSECVHRGFPYLIS